MILTYIAFASLGVALAYAWGRASGHKEATGRIVSALEDGGTAFVKDKVITGYVETYGDWFRCKGTARAELQAKLAAQAAVELPFADSELPYREALQVDRGNVQHAAKVIVQGTARYEHPFLNTGCQG